MKITHIFETHVHADHVSGNMELKSRTGADIYFVKGTPVRFDHREVDEGDILEIGNVKLEFIKTPGHTPYSMSILVTDKSRSVKPWFVLTGDCMFVGEDFQTAFKKVFPERPKSFSALSHFKWVDSHPSMGVPQTTFPSLDGRGLRGG
jgi:glyoxylase-like metal-dependent hydrolase (beta-lactamase superfamily II)